MREQPVEVWFRSTHSGVSHEVASASVFEKSAFLSGGKGRLVAKNRGVNAGCNGV